MVKASLSSISAPHFDENAGYPGPTPQDELAADLEQHIKETLVKEPAAPTLAGSGGIRLHEPLGRTMLTEFGRTGVDSTHDSERIRVPFADDKVRAFVFVRSTDGTACVFFNGEHVETVEDHLSRKGVILAALRALYVHLRKSETKQSKIIAGELNKLTDSMADSLSDFPPGEPCEWPIEVDDTTDDTTTDDSDIDEAGDVVCEGDVDDGSAINSELTPPEGPAAVEIPALAGEACGEKGESFCPPPEKMGVVEAMPGYELTADAVARAKAEYLYEQALNTANACYVAASQRRAKLQEAVKSAKKEEVEQLEVVSNIEARGWQAFLPAKKSAPTTGATTNTTTTATPVIPSHESTLPPPQPEHSAESPSSPQAGVSGANDHPAPPAGDWQVVDIAALNLKKSLATRLREAGHDTIGKLEKLRGQFEGLLSIDGVGRAKADEIEEALLGWLSRNRDAAVLSAAKEKAVAGEGLALEMAAQGQD